MSVSKMTKIQLTATKEAYPLLLDILHTEGIMEIEALEANQENDLFKPESKAEYWQTNVKFALDLLAPYEEEVKKSFLEKLQGEKIEVRQNDFAKLLANFEYKTLIFELENLDKDLNAAKNRISQNKKEVKNLAKWQGIPVDLSESTRFVDFELGIVPITRFEEFTAAIHEKKLAVVLKVSETDKEVRVVVAYDKEVRDELKELFEVSELKNVDMPIGKGQTIESQIKQLEREIEQDQVLVRETKTAIKEYIKHIPDFRILYDYLTWQKDQDEAARKALNTKETVSFTGWMPTGALNEIKDKLNEVSKDYVLEELAISENENIPVALENNRAITPFESVTEIYGAPLYSEPDPTIYLAPFFILYFALCLTDAGYGLLLALLAFAGIKLMKPKGGAKKLMNLMMLGGIATFIIGALFGGWFGIVIADLPDGAMKNFFESVRLIDPVANPMTVLVMSFILGFIQMVVGNLVNMFWKITHSEAKEGILTSGFWAIYLLTIGFWIATMAGLFAGASQIALYLVLGWTGVMVLSQGYEKKSPVMKLLGGISSLYGLVGYLSDILSYSRLLALGLSTGIIAMVVNLVADLFAGMVPYVGFLVWIVIIVGGHLFNLAINVLGAFIHSGRLQYVEYFPKFMVGGGRKFKPLTKQAKYVSLVE